jgi:hypothetical protein
MIFGLAGIAVKVLFFCYVRIATKTKQYSFLYVIYARKFSAL